MPDCRDLGRVCDGARPRTARLDAGWRVDRGRLVPRPAACACGGNHRHAPGFAGAQPPVRGRGRIQPVRAQPRCSGVAGRGGADAARCGGSQPGAPGRAAERRGARAGSCPHRPRRTVRRRTQDRRVRRGPRNHSAKQREPDRRAGRRAGIRRGKHAWRLAWLLGRRGSRSWRRFGRRGLAAAGWIRGRRRISRTSLVPTHDRRPRVPGPRRPTL